MSSHERIVLRSRQVSTDPHDVRLLYIAQCRPQRQETRLHAQDTGRPAQHPSKSSTKHMRSLQSDLEGRARRGQISASYRAADLEAQCGRHYSAVLV